MHGLVGDCLPVEVHAWHVPLHPAWMEIATACCISGRILTVLTDLDFPLQYTQTTIIITLWQFHIKHLLVIATKRTCMPILSKSITTYRKFQDRMNTSYMYVIVIQHNQLSVCAPRVHNIQCSNTTFKQSSYNVHKQ